MQSKETISKIRTQQVRSREEFDRIILSKPFIDLRCDWAFKYFFSHPEMLMKLINDVLPVTVSEIEYLPNEIPVRDEKDKRSVMDVLCKHGNDKFLVEMQQSHTSDMEDRLTYYGATLISNQVKRGDTKYLLHPVYVLCICDYEWDHGDVPENRILFNYQLREKDFGDPFGKLRLQYYTLELPRLQKIWEKTTSNLERWSYLIENFHNFALIPAENLFGFDQVIDLARIDRLDEEEQKEYLNAMATQYDILVHTEAAFDDGVKRGLAEVEAKLAQERIDNAKALLREGVDAEIIARALGLPLEKVESLREANRLDCGHILA